MYAFLTVAASPQTGCAPAFLTPSSVITAGLGRPLQQKQEAVHSMGRDPLTQTHESNRAHPSAAQQKFRSRQQGVEGYSGGRRERMFLSLSLHVCMYVSQRKSGAHLSSSSRVTLLHTRGEYLDRTTPAANGRYKAASEVGNHWMSCTIYWVLTVSFEFQSRF